MCWGEDIAQLEDVTFGVILCNYVPGLQSSGWRRATTLSRSLGSRRGQAQPGHCSYEAAPGPGALGCSGGNSPKRFQGLALALRLWVPLSHREAQGSHLAVKETVLPQSGMTGKGQVGVMGDA